MSRLLYASFTLCFLLYQSLSSYSSSIVDFRTDEVVTAYIIPHSHTDPGWLRTPEHYYDVNVRSILDTVVHELLRFESFKFVWSEIYFFRLWWLERQHLSLPSSLQPFVPKHGQTMARASYGDAIRLVLSRKQLEFVGGGLVQQDEAQTSLSSVLDQLTEGHEFLRSTFGISPSVAYQIDCFGHSSLTPVLFRSAGFTNLIVNRVHHAIKAQMREEQKLEFWWTVTKQDEPIEPDEADSIFTHVLYKHYSSPRGLDPNRFLSLNGTQAEYDSLARALIRTVQRRIRSYRTNNLMIMWGDDFRFQSEGAAKEMLRVIETANRLSADTGIVLRLGTVTEYFESVHIEDAERFPSYGGKGDFFPYADLKGLNYWSGFYASRPQLKAMIRVAESSLRAADVFLALSRLSNDFKSSQFRDLAFELQHARDLVYLSQHHDSITGTSTRVVASDYYDKLVEAVCKSREVLRTLITVTTGYKTVAGDLVEEELHHNPYSNPRVESPLVSTEDILIPIFIFNSLSWRRHEAVEIRISNPSLTVMDANRQVIPHQIVQRSDCFESIQCRSTFSLVFIADMDALSMNRFWIRYDSAQLLSAPSPPVNSGVNQGVNLFNERFRLSIDPSLCVIRDVTSLSNGQAVDTLHLDQSILQYWSSFTVGLGSGVYLFRTNLFQRSITGFVFGFLVVTAVIFFLFMPWNSKQRFLPFRVVFQRLFYRSQNSLGRYLSLRFYRLLPVLSSIPPVLMVAVTGCCTGLVLFCLFLTYSFDFEALGCDLYFGFFVGAVVAGMVLCVSREQWFGIGLFFVAVVGSYVLSYVYLPHWIATPIKGSNQHTNYSIQRGPVLDEVSCQVGTNVFQRFRVYKVPSLRPSASSLIDVLLYARPLPNQEIVSRFDVSGLTVGAGSNRCKVYTDNGLFLVPRAKYSPLRMIPGNTYPFVSYFGIHGNRKSNLNDLQLHVCTRHPSGVVNLDSKSLFELLIHRKVEQDDEKGLREGITEDQAVYVPLKIGLSSGPQWDAKTRIMNQFETTHPLEVIIGSPVTSSSVQHQTNSMKAMSSVMKSLEAFHLFTLRPLVDPNGLGSGHQLLLRLQQFDFWDVESDHFSGHGQFRPQDIQDLFQTSVNFSVRANSVTNLHPGSRMNSVDGLGMQTFIISFPPILDSGIGSSASSTLADSQRRLD
eukprot:GILJ01004750.1.p1 GENE.GILJ01004750.1~~GILJ01004750.1.p1  ORF type:complete len:1167 (-),score=166.19 GILJ01004750.1:3609-7109(-)